MEDGSRVRGPTADSMRGRARGALAAILAGAAVIAAPWPALAGPPYISDDPEPTDYRRYEIYLFTTGANARGGTAGQAGIDFNYGGAPDLQLTAVLPLAFQSATGGGTSAGLGNAQLAAKYRFLHQKDIGLDVAVFPRLFLPSSSPSVGLKHASLLLPLWVERDWSDWSIFGGGGCEYNRGSGSKDFCLFGGTLARQFLPNLQLGVEATHQTPAVKGGRAATTIGIGMHYDVNDTYHVLAYGAKGLQNAADTGRYLWYAAMLFTF
jgi:hypothetical protein